MTKPIVVNGWEIRFHQCFIDQLNDLLDKVERAKQKDPEGYKSKNATKRLAAIYNFVFNEIPQDPGAEQYLQGNTLGKEYRAWRRVKFFERYRLYFRYDAKVHMILIAWVNDENTLRARGSKTDAYAVFAGMLDNGNPPDSWAKLEAACAKPADLGALRAKLGGLFSKSP